jgi:hypothetical protein
MDGRPQATNSHLCYNRIFVYVISLWIKHPIDPSALVRSDVPSSISPLKILHFFIIRPIDCDKTIRTIIVHKTDPCALVWSIMIRTYDRSFCSYFDRSWLYEFFYYPCTLELSIIIQTSDRSFCISLIDCNKIKWSILVH